MFGEYIDDMPYARFYELVEMLKIHGQIEYGTDDINVEALVAFINSNRVMVRFMNCSPEEVAKGVTEDILDGMPVWKFFNLSPWTEKMLQKEYDEYRKEAEERYQKRKQEALKKYKCLQQCKYYNCCDTGYGTYIACEYKGNWMQSTRERSGDNFKYLRKCSHYEKDETKPTDPMYIE